MHTSNCPSTKYSIKKREGWLVARNNILKYDILKMTDFNLSLFKGCLSDKSSPSPHHPNIHHAYSKTKGKMLRNKSYGPKVKQLTCTTSLQECMLLRCLLLPPHKNQNAEFQTGLSVWSEMLVRKVCSPSETHAIHLSLNFISADIRVRRAIPAKSSPETSLKQAGDVDEWLGP
uniref:Uncharacterized protein n=1 Tax=Opuntia streptacantha TaxID=393608 RepID=A0A7C8YEC6_OPUST